MMSLTIPIGSMYGICTYIWMISLVNVGNYTIHGSYGIWWIKYIDHFIHCHSRFALCGFLSSHHILAYTVYLHLPLKRSTKRYELYAYTIILLLHKKFCIHQEFQVPKMEVLNLIRLFLGMGFPLHKPYPYSLYRWGFRSLLGTWNSWWMHPISRFWGLGCEWQFGSTFAYRFDFFLMVHTGKYPPGS